MPRAAYLTAAPNQSVWVCDTPVTNNVAASVTSVTLMDPDDGRSHGTVFNDSTAVLYLKWGAGASATSFSTKVPPQALYELPRVSPYVGIVTGAWASANGAARITVAS